MLEKTRDLYHEFASDQDEPHVTGQYLAKNHLKARDRAHLAADIVNERVKVKDLTIRQAARLCRVSVPYVNNARRPPPVPETLAEHFARTSPDEWLAAARTIGPAIIWDHMIAPLV